MLKKTDKTVTIDSILSYVISDCFSHIKTVVMNPKCARKIQKHIDLHFTKNFFKDYKALIEHFLKAGVSKTVLQSVNRKILTNEFKGDFIFGFLISRMNGESEQNILIKDLSEAFEKQQTSKDDNAKLEREKIINLLDLLKNSVKDLEAENSVLKNQILDLETNHKEKEKKLKEGAESTNSEHQKEKTKLTCEFDELNQELRKINEKYKVEVDRLRTVNTELEEKNKVVQGKLAEAAEEKERIEIEAKNQSQIAKNDLAAKNEEIKKVMKEKLALSQKIEIFAEKQKQQSQPQNTGIERTKVAPKKDRVPEINKKLDLKKQITTMNF